MTHYMVEGYTQKNKGVLTNKVGPLKMGKKHT